MGLYEFARVVCTGYVRLFYRAEHIGAEKVPEKGGVIFCSNHTSNLDPVLIGTIKQRKFSFMAKESLLKIPVLGYIIKKLGIIPVKRNHNDITAVKRAIEAINEGKAIMIFPEGTRSKDGKLLAPKDGAALLVKKTGAPVVPCAVRKKGLFRKSKIIYGNPIDMSGYKDTKDIKAVTEIIMNNIKALLEEIDR